MGKALSLVDSESVIHIFRPLSAYIIQETPGLLPNFNNFGTFLACTTSVLC